MAWFIQAREIADTDGEPTGRWRLTATSDEDGGGPFGDTTHDHETPEEAEACERCDEYCSGIAGFPSKRKEADLLEQRERWELARLKQKYEGQS
jgi:hypothetical protein